MGDGGDGEDGAGGSYGVWCGVEGDVNGVPGAVAEC